MPTEYRVTLCKKENGGLPVITPCTIREESYNKILKIIHGEQRILTQGRNAGKKYRE